MTCMHLFQSVTGFGDHMVGREEEFCAFLQRLWHLHMCAFCFRTHNCIWLTHHTNTHVLKTPLQKHLQIFMNMQSMPELRVSDLRKYLQPRGENEDEQKILKTFLLQQTLWITKSPTTPDTEEEDLKNHVLQHLSNERENSIKESWNRNKDRLGVVIFSA